MQASGGLGFIVGPLLSIAFGGVQGDSNDVVLLNYETLPAYLAALMCLLNIWVMVKNFQEFRLQEMGLGDGDGGADLPSKGEGAERRTAEPNAKPTNEDDIEANVIASTQPPLKHSAIAVLLSVYFLVYVCLSLSETVSVPLAITEFGTFPLYQHMASFLPTMPVFNRVVSVPRCVFFRTDTLHYCERCSN